MCRISMLPKCVVLVATVVIPLRGVAQQCDWDLTVTVLNKPVYDMEIVDDGGREVLYLVGEFDNPERTRYARPRQASVSLWDGSQFETVYRVYGSKRHRSVAIFDLAAMPTSKGTDLFISGRFHGERLHWDGEGWTRPRLGPMLDSVDVWGEIATYAIYHRGRMFRYDGVKWERLTALFGGGTPLVVISGQGAVGDVLVVGGSFTHIRLLPTNGIAFAFHDKDGRERWNTFGDGMDGPVNALAIFDGSLYAAGEFGEADGMPAPFIARWDGSSWQDVGGGLDGPVETMEVFDDGTGPALYAGGGFSQAGGATARGIARWDGTAWTEVGGGIKGTVYALKSFDDGNGPALFVGGDILKAGSHKLHRGGRHLVKWAGCE